MQSKQVLVQDTLTRVQRFLDEHADVVGDVNTSEFRAVLNASVDKLAMHAVDQTSSIRGAVAETAQERVLRSKLRLNHMRPIAAVARAKLHEIPELVAVAMPSADTNSRELIACASAMAFVAALNEQTFVAAGLPKDFLARLSAAAGALEDILATRGETRSAQVGATSGLGAEASRGRRAIRVLDALVEPLIAGDISLLAEWKAAKRFAGRTPTIDESSIDAAASGPVPGSPVPGGALATGVIN